MKTEKQIKERIKDLDFCICIAKTNNFQDLIQKYKEEQNILHWILSNDN